jgi:hypothetical protein
MKGKKKSPPDEAVIVMMSEKFGVTPMELEERMTQKWWDWATAYYEESSGRR